MKTRWIAASIFCSLGIAAISGCATTSTDSSTVSARQSSPAGATSNGVQNTNALGGSRGSGGSSTSTPGAGAGTGTSQAKTGNGTGAGGRANAPATPPTATPPNQGGGGSG